MLFLVVLHYKMRGRPAQARARPEPGPKIEARCVQWDGHGKDFFGPKKQKYFQPDPNPARPKPGLARKMLRSNGYQKIKKGDT
jgi:hypothetical protein